MTAAEEIAALREEIEGIDEQLMKSEHALGSFVATQDVLQVKLNTIKGRLAAFESFRKDLKNEDPVNLRKYADAHKAVVSARADQRSRLTEIRQVIQHVRKLQTLCGLLRSRRDLLHRALDSYGRVFVFEPRLGALGPREGANDDRERP